jgi:hypothetical protein
VMKQPKRLFRMRGQGPKRVYEKPDSPYNSA